MREVWDRHALCHVAFLPGGTSGHEAGEQEKAEVPSLKGTDVRPWPGSSVD